MTAKSPDVKCDRADDFEPRSRLIAWIDAHPRTGWHLALWATIITINALVDFV